MSIPGTRDFHHGLLAVATAVCAMTRPPTTVWLLLLAFMPVACGGGDDPVSPTAPSREVSISIAGPTSLVVGASSQLTATAMLSDGSTEDVTNSATGNGAGTIQGGRHIRLSPDTPLMNLHVSLLDKMGIPVDRVGDSTGALPELSAL